MTTPRPQKNDTVVVSQFQSIDCSEHRDSAFRFCPHPVVLASPVALPPLSSQLCV